EGRRMVRGVRDGQRIALRVGGRRVVAGPAGTRVRRTGATDREVVGDIVAGNGRAGRAGDRRGRTEVISQDGAEVGGRVEDSAASGAGRERRRIDRSRAELERQRVAVAQVIEAGLVQGRARLHRGDETADFARHRGGAGDAGGVGRDRRGAGDLRVVHGTE